MNGQSYIFQWRNPSVEPRIISRQPIDWQSEFHNDNPVDLEIGIGNGSFLAPFAKNHPERNIIGVEIDGKYLKKADSKLIRQNITNARLMIGDAKLLVWSLIADGSVDHLYIHFPDPWFKKRHKKRRLVNPVTLRLFARKIRSAITVSTDDEEYKDWVLDCVREAGCLENVFDTPWVAQLEEHYTTKYEKKWRAQGKPIYFMRFRKTAHPPFDDDEFVRSQNLSFPLLRLKDKYKTNETMIHTHG